MFKVAIFCCALFTVALAATPFKDCGSTYTLKELRVPGCTSLPCIVYRGSNYSIEYDFTATSPATSLVTDVKGTFSGITAPWPGTFPPGCDSLTTGSCPLTVNEEATQTVDLVLSSAWPSVQATVTWQVLDENDKVLICFIVTCSVL